uniref:Uncharacterized protein n=1 Tax=Chromera velia CCMP2878 TaxID=1169474 RepID=A0A0G4GHI0_9ALVE|mmetsp:Transcript_17600/g.35720  ORF Transcript_17600/g.35720 Transcript_17600/m.35720 type:complete len:170 (+) Transcript_17600:152-661(+)|eukprot:Cvel_660.t1-p1 / transcript=Cvel_660.t1 / gene=Cvel_660 / organism=Chromera_velia_CCMP2878 / gene_product=hypothetical protein / transcript_product=hypothetical protein / location=Cvel_scaffold20:113830-116615(-) / protein_length=169 / sequence_SO=supercontig / SO=protein_coding / is_pseudo=false
MTAGAFEAASQLLTSLIDRSGSLLRDLKETQVVAEHYKNGTTEELRKSFEADESTQGGASLSDEQIRLALGQQCVRIVGECNDLCRQTVQAIGDHCQEWDTVGRCSRLMELREDVLPACQRTKMVCGEVIQRHSWKHYRNIILKNTLGVIFGDAWLPPPPKQENLRFRW